VKKITKNFHEIIIVNLYRIATISQTPGIDIFVEVIKNLHKETAIIRKFFEEVGTNATN